MAISLLNAGPSTVVAEPTDLPYRLVEPGKWEFSGSGYDPSKSYSISEAEISGIWYYDLDVDDDFPDQVTSQTKLDVVNFPNASLTATRNVLHDRAGNLVVVSGDTTLTLPAANPGYLRDFLVRLTVSASSAITFSAQTGETITWDAMGAPPSSFAEGTYLYHITEVAQGVFHAEDMMALVGLDAALAAINGGVAS